EDLLVARARFRRADRVDEQLRRPNAERPPQPCRQDDQLGVDLRLLEAERLDGELVELAVPALLRFLAPEHRAARPELLLLIVQQAVRQARADDAGRRLGPQRDAVAAAILERVHLLLDDVRELADRAAKELRALEHRDADSPVVIGLEQARGLRLETLPQRLVFGQHVVHAPNGAQRSTHRASILRERECENGQRAASASRRVRERLAVDPDRDAVGVAEPHRHVAVDRNTLLSARGYSPIKEPLAARGRDLRPRILLEAELDLERGARGFHGRGRRLAAVRRGIGRQRDIIGDRGDRFRRGLVIRGADDRLRARNGLKRHRGGLRQCVPGHVGGLRRYVPEGGRGAFGVGNPAALAETGRRLPHNALRKRVVVELPPDDRADGDDERGDREGQQRGQLLLVLDAAPPLELGLSIRDPLAQRIEQRQRIETEQLAVELQIAFDENGRADLVEAFVLERGEKPR